MYNFKLDFICRAAEKKELEKKEKIDGLLEKQRVQQYGEFCQWESEKLEKIKIAEKGIIKQTLLEQIKNKLIAYSCSCTM